jgi:hypothetical protein
MQDLLSTLLLSYTVSEASREIWKRHVISLYPNLTVEKIRAYMTGARDWVREGSWRLVDLIVCNMSFYNAVLGDVDAIICPIPDRHWDDDPEDDLEARDLEKRSSRSFTRTIGGAEWIVRSLAVSLSSSKALLTTNVHLLLKCSIEIGVGGHAITLSGARDMDFKTTTTA